MSETLQKESVLKKYLKKYWYFVVMAVVFSTLSNYFNLQLPLYITTLVDKIIQQNQFQLIPSFILSLIQIFLWAGIFSLLQMLATQYMSTNIIYQIRNDMYKALQIQSYQFYDQNRTGNLMSKTTSDVTTVNQFLSNQFQGFIKNFFTFGIIFYEVWRLNWVMSIIFMGLTPPLFILMMWYRKRIRPASYNMYVARGMLFSTMEENISGVRVVKAFGRQKMELEKYNRENTEFINKSKRVIRLQTFYGPISEYMTNVGSAIIVFIGGWLVISHQMTLGDVVGIFVYFSMVYDPIRSIVNFFNQLSANRAALDRVNEILENRNDIDVLPKPIDPGRVLGDLFLRLLKDEKIIQKIDEYLELDTEIPDAAQQSKNYLLKKYEEANLLPSGVKIGAVENIGFKGNKPLILAKGETIKPIAQKIAKMVRYYKFQLELEEVSGLSYKKGEEKSFNPIRFIMQYFIYLLKNEPLMLKVYETVSKTSKKDLGEVKEYPMSALFEYIQYFAGNESEIKRVEELQQILYSPKPKEHIQIAKKYDKLLTKKGILAPSRKETILASQSVTTDALSFLKLEKDIIGQKYSALRRLNKNRFPSKTEEIEDLPVPKIKPIQLNTKFQEISWSPVKTSNITGHVKMENVWFSYETMKSDEEKNWALENINLEVKPGEIIAFLGATGSGKSTLINLIPRFYDSTRGDIYIDGVNLKELDLKLYRQQIGIVAQETFLFSRSIKENICYGKKGVKEEDMVAVAQIAKIHDFIMSLPDQYNTIVGERGQSLSGGQKQRIAIARALLLDPKILILDDSLSAVDVDTEYEIQESLNHLFKGRTTFIITQRISTIRNCDRIIILDDGKIVERGTHEELLELDGIYTRIYETMFKKHTRDKTLHVTFNEKTGLSGEYKTQESPKIRLEINKSGKEKEIEQQAEENIKDIDKKRKLNFKRKSKNSKEKENKKENKKENQKENNKEDKKVHKVPKGGPK